jgi:pimeloyl-ACP methyl ester carboxylesterase
VLERRFEGFRAVQICFDDFLGEFAMLAWIASQSAYLELAAGLQGTCHGTSLLPRGVWRTKPSFYAVSTQDRTINPDLERFMAKRMGAKTIEIDASHLGLISQPDAITDLILEALAV